MRRVLFPFVGDSVGGSHISALELVRGLDRGRYNAVVAIHQEGRLRNYVETQGIAAERAPAWTRDPFSGDRATNVVATLCLLPRLISFLRRQRIDIVHTQDARMHFLWSLAAKVAGVKCVLHLRAVRQSRIGYSSKCADEIIAISKYTRDQCSEKIRKRCEVIVNPFTPVQCDMDRETCRREVLRASFSTPQASAVVGYVANLTQQKRPVEFVEIARRLRERFEERIFFPMYGETDGTRDRSIKEAVVERIERYGLTTQCMLMGPEYPIEPRMMGLDVLVAPAVGEALGRTLVEAMLCGTPVVAADDGGHREIIRHGETGFLVQPDSPDAFAVAVADLLENPRLANAVATAAKEEALRKYSVEAHVEKVQAVYDAVLR